MPRLGYKQTKEHRKKLKEVQIKIQFGRHGFAWKEKVGYRAVHLWVELKLGKPKKCEHCEKDELFGRKIHWANISHLYLRQEEDWIRLCSPCHGIYDKINNLRKK